MLFKALVKVPETEYEVRHLPNGGKICPFDAKGDEIDIAVIDSLFAKVLT